MSETSQRNEEALRLMQTPCVGAFLGEIRDEIREDWELCQDTAGREQLHADLTALARLVAKLAEAGTQAEIDRNKEAE